MISLRYAVFTTELVIFVFAFFVCIKPSEIWVRLKKLFFLGVIWKSESFGTDFVEYGGYC